MSNSRRVARSPALAAICCSLLVLLLPTLAVGLSIAAPATPGELQRVERALVQQSASERIDSSVSRMFHTAAIAGAVWPGGDGPDSDQQRQNLIVSARLAQVLGISALAFLTYLSVLLARGRLQALLACALLAALPPVTSSGYVLRPETPAILFATLTLVLLQSASRPTPRDRHRRPMRSVVLGGGLMLCAIFSAGLACETLPSRGEILLLPGLVLLLCAVQLLFRGVRCLRRRGLMGTPIRALNQRLLPWIATALLAPAAALWLLFSSLTVGVEALARTEPTSSLLPDSTIAYGLAVGLLAIGFVSGVVRVGLRFGRGGRIGADLILLVFCAVFLLTSALGSRSQDPLPQLPAMAVLLSEGLRTLLVLALAVFKRRKGAGS